MSRRFRGERDGLAAPEVVFLLAMALMVVSVVLPTFLAGKSQHRLLTAQSDVEEILAAAQKFFQEYGVWPTAYAGDQGDILYGRLLPNHEVINALRAVAGTGNEDHSVNPKRIAFLEPRAATDGASGIDDRGEFLDPWGTPYHVVVDANLNNVCDARGTIYTQVIGEGCIVWSSGPDRISDTEDDLRSWKWAPIYQLEPGVSHIPE